MEDCKGNNLITSENNLTKSIINCLQYCSTPVQYVLYDFGFLDGDLQPQLETEQTE